MIKLTKEEKEILKKAELITEEDYEINEERYVSDDSIIRAVTDLVAYYENLEEKFNDYTRHVENNYIEKSFDPYYEYGVSQKDFY